MLKSLLGWFDDERGEAGAAKNDPVSWKEKRRDNRIDLLVGKELSVHLLSPDSGEKATTLIANVRNVSMRGCGLIFKTKQDRDQAKPDQVFVASLAVDDFPIPLNVKVIRWIGDKELAVQFKPPFPRELEKLERFMEPRCLGRSLREIDPKALKKEDRKGLRWFQGVNETGLFSWVDTTSGEISQQQLVFLEMVVEWQEGKELRTGKVRPGTPTGEFGMNWVQSELLEFDPSVNTSSVAQAQAILESSKIDENVKEKFLEKLKIKGA